MAVGDQVCLTKWLPPGEDVLELPLNQILSLTTGVISGMVNTGGVTSEIAPIPSIIGMSYDLGRIIGLYAAEGHCDANKIRFSFNLNEENTIVAELVDLLKSTLSIKARLQYRPNNCLNVVIYGKTWTEVFKMLVPGTSKHGDKRLSSHVTSGNKEFLRGVLEGWFDGDGHARRTEQQGITVSHQLGQNMYDIAQGLGLFPVIRTSKPSLNKWAKTRQDRWEVIIPTGEGNRPASTSKGVFRKVTDISKTTYTDYVFNMHVEGDNSYVANGVGVHNCVGFGWSHELSATPSVVPTLAPGALSIYNRAKQLDQWEGENYDGTSVLAGAKAVSELRNNVGTPYISEYRWAFGLQDLLLSLAHNGPVVLGLNWFNNMFDTDANGYLHPTGGLAGGHCLLAIGVVIVSAITYPTSLDEIDLDKSYVVLHNSWGKDWGQAGRAKVTLRDMAFLLSQEGEACVPMIRNADVIVYPPATNELPPVIMKTYFSTRYSSVFHGTHPGIRSYKTYTTYDQARNLGLRPCYICKPTT